MATAAIPGVALHTLRAVVPAREICIDEEVDQYPGGAAQLARMKQTLGVDRRRVVEPGQTACDLGEIAARATLDAADGSMPDALLFVTQTPDHLQPGNAPLLHGRLGLPTSCAAFDVNHGCAGFVYGLWLAHSLIAAGGCRRVLLVCGDTLSRIVHPEDLALRPLFGDAAAAVLLEADPKVPTAYFDLQTDGSGHAALRHPASALRAWPSPENADVTRDADGNARSPQNLHMDGAAVFSFSIQRVPAALRALAEQTGQPLAAGEGVFLHQANRYIVRSIAKRLGLEVEQVPSDSFSRFGNTSSASIPLALADAARKAVGPVALCGFGTGLSWASAWLETPFAAAEILDLAAWPATP